MSDASQIQDHTWMNAWIMTIKEAKRALVRIKQTTNALEPVMRSILEDYNHTERSS